MRKAFIISSIFLKGDKLMKISKKTVSKLVFCVWLLFLQTSLSAEASETNSTSIISSDKTVPKMVSLENTSKVKERSHLYLSLYGFASEVNGNIGMGNKTTNAYVPFSEIWHNLDSNFMGYLDFNKDKWGLALDYQYSKVSMDKQTGMQIMSHTTIPLDINLMTKLNRTSVGIYYTAIDKSFPSSKQRLRLEPTIGIHFTNVSAKVGASSAYLPQQLNEERSIYWSEPYIGTRFLFEFNKKWNLAGQVDFGTKNSKGYQVYVGHRTKVFDLPANIRIGYRMISQKHREGDFNWNIRQYGPVVGLSLQFN